MLKAVNNNVIETVLKSNRITIYNLDMFSISDLKLLSKEAREKDIKISLKSDGENTYVQFFKNSVDKEFLLESI